MSRVNTQLEAAGTEYLVLGNLLRRRIQSFICSRNFEGYDLVAINPERNRSIKIQVKSRFTESAMSFPIKKFGSDVIVFVKLNCGRRKEGRLTYEYRKHPEFYIFPTELCKKYSRKGDWRKVHIKNIPNYEKHRDNWGIIKRKLKLK
jgi:hypothetical protein